MAWILAGGAGFIPSLLPARAWGAAFPSEPLGQCSRLTSLVISEIMYNPPGQSTRLEFVELFNSRLEPEDVSGFRLSGAIDFLFPENTIIPGRGFLVVARVPAELAAVTGLTGILGPWSAAETNGLPNDSGIVRLRHRSGAVFLEVEYSSQAPWPSAADGAGHSLVLARPSLGERNPLSWAHSRMIGGSPGAFEPQGADPLDGMLINEILANSDAPAVDFIELFNATPEPKDLSSAVLTDTASLARFRVPQGTTLPPGGFVHFTQAQLGFGLDATGERLFLINSNLTRVVDAVDFGAQQQGVAAGRSPNGAREFVRLTQPTPGESNSAELISPIVINEIMYAPPSDDDDEQYIELHNTSPVAIPLAGWRIRDGIEFLFPSGAGIPANGYVVVARNAARLRSMYPQLNATSCFGDFSGRLSGSGERLVLTRPVLDLQTNGTSVVTNTMEIAVNEVTYADGGRWPEWADGGGSSLELIDPLANHRLASNWAESDEAAKAPWTLISVTGRVDNVSTTADQLQVLLSGPGECLIDNVQVLNPSGQNLIANPGFEANATGWTAEGTEAGSAWETAEGYESPRSYRIRAVDRGDNQVNRVRTPLTTSIPSGTDRVIIRAAARWLRGAPNILLRLRGNGLECAGELALPPDPGTPGQPNSRQILNAPPAISDVQHWPVLPAASESITVSARIDDPQGLNVATLRYRIDPSPATVAVPMRDDGTGADRVAADGIYSAQIPGQPAGALVAFYVLASDTQGTVALFPIGAPARECLVRVGETQPAGQLPIYRIWMTQATLNTWNTRSKLNNTPLDITFVLGNERVIYNASGLYAGSPYIAPGYCGASCGRCGYSLSFPADDRFLGDTDLVLDWPGGHGNETTAIQEQMGYWIADRLNLPFSHRYHIRLHVNGVTDDARRTIFEAVLQPGRRYIEAWYPNDSDGQFFKIDRAFEFSDGGSLSADPQPRLQNYTTVGGAKKREKYRWTWLYRATERVHDYTNLFAAVDALNAQSTETYTTATEGLIDVEQWMRTFALEHIIINFDAYGHVIGKNMYSYLPTQGKWQMFIFDLDWLMLAATGFRANYTASSAPLFDCDDPTISRMYQHPPFLRAYWRAVQDAVDGPLNPAICNSVMDAKYAALLTNRVAWCDNSPLTAPNALKTWFSQRRTALQTQLANVAAPFEVTGTGVSGNVATLTGRAPINVHTILFNGVARPITWTSVNNWTAEVPLLPGSNTIEVAGVDAGGRPILDATAQATAVFTGSIADPRGSIVISEIMHSPLIPNAAFVELHNRSESAFDLSGWVFDGLNYTFPPGSMIGPDARLLLVRNREAVVAAHGVAAVALDEFDADLSPGTALRLFRPGDNNPITAVRFDATAPWPSGAERTGSSLQLIDPAQDNSRVGNWAVLPPDAPAQPTPQWVRFATRGNATSSTLYIYLQSPGEIYVDDMSLALDGIVPGTNLIANAGFEAPLAGTWNATANFVQSTISTAVRHSGNSSLRLVATAPGSGSGNAINQVISPALVNGAPYALSFWYLQTTNAGPLVVRLSNSGVTSGPIDPAPAMLSSAAATPGAPNSVAAVLQPFLALWINEAQPANQSGITNGAGARVSWLELHNRGPQPVALDGLFLSTNVANLAASGFPAGAVLQPGEFRVVFADGEPMTSTNGDWTAAFTLPKPGGVVLLARAEGNVMRVIDHLAYGTVKPNHSFGAYPDGQAIDRREFSRATPGGPNNPAVAPVSVFINEWMADNDSAVREELTGEYDDWFELYNAADAPADLSGYFLSDSLAEPEKVTIPVGVTIPPNGYLLVWADGYTSAAGGELHVDFSLSKSGEVLLLTSPDGATVDYVSFGVQETDVSQGRYPDGTAALFSMTNATPRAPNVLELPHSLPPLSEVKVIEGKIQFLAAVSVGNRYQLEFSESLDPTSWIPVGTPYPGTNSPVLIEAPLSSSRGFYRLRLVP